MIGERAWGWARAARAARWRHWSGLLALAVVASVGSSGCSDNSAEPPRHPPREGRPRSHRQPMATSTVRSTWAVAG